MVSAVPAAILLACLYLVDLPFYVVSPGPADDALPLIDIDGRETFPSGGRLLFTTVYAGPGNVYDVARASVDDGARVVPESLFLQPGQTDAEYDAQQRSAMDQSKLDAAAVALREVTRYPERHGRGAVVESVFRGTPAEGRLFPGDLVISAGDRAVRSIDDLADAIQRAGAGGELSVEVRPIEGGDVRRVVLRPARIGGDVVIGVSLIENFPFDVRIESGDIGGPSAGLMWAIGIVDLLTPGDLTGGRTIAGTGDIDLEGNVAPIGGITEKLIAAERAGAELFLVPEANMEEARATPASIDLVSVATLDDALHSLEG
ncbi:MAG TPA: S16 family serine protease [Actinomycetota bacterium]|nr:S16 family serine protease [Actinomycetota bacterium]